MDAMAFLIAFALYSLVCGAFGAYIAAEKRRSPVEGAIFGAVLGLIGLIVLAMLPANSPARREPAGDDDDPIDWQGLVRTSQRSGQPVASLDRRKPRKLLGEVSEPWMGDLDEWVNSPRPTPPPLP